MEIVSTAGADARRYGQMRLARLPHISLAFPVVRASLSNTKERIGMRVAIHLTKEEETKALPILLRHSPGIILPQGTYVLAGETLKALRKAGIRFTELSRETAAPRLEEVVGERV